MKKGTGAAGPPKSILYKGLNEDCSEQKSLWEFGRRKSKLPIRALIRNVVKKAPGQRASGQGAPGQSGLRIAIFGVELAL